MEKALGGWLAFSWQAGPAGKLGMCGQPSWRGGGGLAPGVCVERLHRGTLGTLWKNQGTLWGKLFIDNPVAGLMPLLFGKGKCDFLDCRFLRQESFILQCILQNVLAQVHLQEWMIYLQCFSVNFPVLVVSSRGENSDIFLSARSTLTELTITPSD